MSNFCTHDARTVVRNRRRIVPVEVVDRFEVGRSVRLADGTIGEIRAIRAGGVLSVRFFGADGELRRMPVSMSDCSLIPRS